MVCKLVTAQAQEDDMPERILVVDDEPNMLRLLKTILMDKTGY